MSKIDARALRYLRDARGWTQEELADKTKGEGLPALDSQTISRLERGERGNTRPRTIRQLSRALHVEPAVLTGDAPLPELQRLQNPAETKSQLNFRVGAAQRNAYTLVAKRYGVEPAEIVGIAPFLFVLAAEESLRQRRAQIEEIERVYQDARRSESKARHLPIDHTLVDDKLAAEQESIEKRDLFGTHIIEETDFLDRFGHCFDPDTENPFARFLRDRAALTDGVATFEEWGSWSPQYRVCPEEAARLVGGDQDRAEEILEGLVALNEMPKELRAPGKEKERAEWVREKAEEERRAREQALADLDLFFEDKGKASK